MRHRQAKLRALAVLQPEHVAAHAGPSSALFPNLPRVQGWQVKLLPNCVHLLANDGDNLVQSTVSQEQVRVKSRPKLADIPGAKQKLMACNLRVGRRLPQSRN